MERLLFIILMASFGANAEVYKCHGSGGIILYQQAPCPGAPNAKPMDLDLPPPEVLLRLQQEAEERDLRNEAEEQAEEKAERELKEAEQNDMAPEITTPQIEYLPVFIYDGYPRYLPFFNLYHPSRPRLFPAYNRPLKDHETFKGPFRQFGNLSHGYHDHGDRRR